MRWVLLVASLVTFLSSAGRGLPVSAAHQAEGAESSVGAITTVAVGRAPRGVAVDRSTHRLYVANAGDGTVSVVDGTNLRTLATVPVGREPCCVAVDPSTHRVYVANTKGDTVSVLDGLSNRSIATAPSGVGPYALAVDPSSHTVYVADHGDRATIDRLGGYDPRLRLIDGVTNQIVAAQPVVAEAAGNDLTQVAGISVDPDAHSVILAINRKESSGLVFLDSGTHRETGAIGLTNDIPGIVIASAFDAVADTLVVSLSPGFLSILPPSPEQRFVVPGTVQHPCRDVCVLEVAVDSDTHTLYVVRRPASLQAPSPLVAPALLVEDERGTLLATVPLGQSPSAIAVDTTTHAVYVADEMGNTVTMLRGVGYSPPLPSALPPMGGGGGAWVGVGGIGGSEFALSR